MKYLFIILFAIMFAACSSNQNQDFSTSTQSAVAPEMKQVSKSSEPSDITDKPNTQQNRMLVKTASISIRVDNLKQSKSRILQDITNFNGYISSENESSYDNSLHNNLVLRIPTASFDKMMTDIEAVATYVENRQVNVQDVTAEYVDIQARLNARKAVEQSYLNLLNKATSIDDILKIQEQLGAVRGDIESMQGQLNLMGSQVQFSTINLELIKTLPYTAEPGKGFGFRFRKAIGEGWLGFLNILIFTVDLWPLLLVAIIIWVFYRRFGRGRLRITKK